MKVPWFILCFCVNVLGAGRVLYVALDIVHLMKVEQRDYSDANDSITFFCNIFVVFVVCLPVNLFWGITALYIMLRRREDSAAVAFCVMIAVWAATFLAIRLI